MNNKTESKQQYHLPAGSLYKQLHTVLLFALPLLFIMNVLPSCKNNNTASQNQAQNSKDSLAAVTDTLQSKFNAARLQVDDYATKSARLDSLIKLKEMEIAKLKAANGHLERNNKQLAAELKTDKKLIASLKQDLNDKSKSYEERLGMLENDKNDLMRQRDSLLAKYNKVVALGSVLHASNIRLTAIHLKHHGRKEKDTKRARRADELKVDFDIDENRIAESGTKKLYLVIKDPSGNLLSNTATGSGVTTTSNGAQLSYSLLKEIPLIINEPVKDISVDWKQEGDYQKGDYTITIYNGGYKIGGGQVDLR